jgi:hypothetical protein
MKNVEDIRFHFNEINPFEIAEIINKAHIIIVSTNIHGCWRKKRSRGEVETLVEIE